MFNFETLLLLQFLSFIIIVMLIYCFNAETFDSEEILKLNPMGSKRLAH